MAQPTISRVRDCIRSLNHAVSLHAADKLDDDDLTHLDLETTLLTRHITGRQRDRKTPEVTLAVRAHTIYGRAADTIVQFSQIRTRFVIAVYLV